MTDAPSEMSEPTRPASRTTVVIKSRDDPRIVDCVASIPTHVAVVVVVAANDPARRLLSSDPRVVFVDPGTEDLGAKVNAGIDMAPTDHVLLMDADCTFSPGAVDRIEEVLGRLPVARCLIAFDPGRRWTSRAIARWREAENNTEPVPAYAPGLGIDLHVRDQVGWPLFPVGVGFSHDDAFNKSLARHRVPITLVPDAVVHHASISLGHFLRSGFRTGRGTARQTALGLRTHQERFIWVVTRALRGRFIIWWTQQRQACGHPGALVGTAWLAAYRIGYHEERLRALFFRLLPPGDSTRESLSAMRGRCYSAEGRAPESVSPEA